MHAVAYGLLMGWFAQIFKHDLARLLFVAAFIALGVAMEYAQGLVPSRQFDFLDMIANASGVVLAWALAYTWIGGILEWFEVRCLRTNLKA
jgi:VanZ family protein